MLIENSRRKDEQFYEQENNKQQKRVEKTTATIFLLIYYVVSLAATQECQHGVFRRKLPIHIYNSSEGEHVDVSQSEIIKSIASSEG